MTLYRSSIDRSMLRLSSVQECGRDKFFVQESRLCCKNIRISTDILWRVFRFRILPGSTLEVLYCFTTCRVGQKRAHIFKTPEPVCVIVGIHLNIVLF